MKKTLSVVVPTSGTREKELLECLESLENQTKKPDEIILICTPFSACKNLNMGLKYASGYYIGILDDDATVPNDWAEKILDKFDEEPDSTAVISTMIVEPGMPDYMYNHVKNTERYWGAFNGNGTIFKKYALEKAGYFSEKFEIYVNERDLGAKILKLGYRIKHYPEIKTNHKNPFGERTGKIPFYYATRNQYWYYWKHYPIIRAILKSFNFTIYKSIKAIKQKEILALFMAITDAFLGIGYCIKNRKVCKCVDIYK